MLHWKGKQSFNVMCLQCVDLLLWHCRSSSADMTHSFSRDASCLYKIFTATSKSLTSLVVENCNDIFGGPAFEHLSMLSQLVKLHVSSVRTRLHPVNLENLSSLKQLQVLSQLTRHWDLCCTPKRDLILPYRMSRLWLTTTLRPCSALMSCLVSQMLCSS